MAKTHLIAEAGKQEIVITRVFDQTRDQLFKVITDPQSLPQWWGTGKKTAVVEKMDLRIGGLWRLVQLDEDGQGCAFFGVYHEVERPKRLVYTCEFGGMPGHVLLKTLILEELGGKTLLMHLSVFQSVEDRDEMFRSEMEAEAGKSMDRLEGLLGKF